MAEKFVFSHKPVLFDACMDALQIRPDGVYVDGTAGGGGHSSGIAQRLTSGRLLAIDRDADAVKAAGARLSSFGERVRVVRANFSELADVCREEGVDAIDGLLLDLGVSSYQLDNAERGFSYQADAPLDMRMDERCTRSAYDVVNTYPEERLRQILYDYGAKEVHMRIACPPLIYACPFVGFSASKNALELITRRIIKELEGDENKNLEKYATTGSPEYDKMVSIIAERFGLSSLKFNTLETLIEAIGLPKCKVCTHCFDGSSHF